MYNAIVMDHVTNRRNVGPLETATHRGAVGAPGDGPYMILWLEVADGRIQRAAYQTYSCPAAVACGSMMAQILIGRTVEQAQLITTRDIELLLQGIPAGKEHCPRLVIEALANAWKGRTDNGRPQE